MRQTRKNKIFTKLDYLSGDGMMTKIWGPPAWFFLHTISFNYPIHPTAEDKIHYRDFILSLQYTLPCKYCRMNLTNNFKKMPLSMAHMESRETFSRYIYDLHEMVNKMLGKSSGLSYTKVRERFEHFRSRCTAEEANAKVFTFRTTRRQKNISDKDDKLIKDKQIKNKDKQIKEKGCTEPLYGKKSRCILNIVPIEDKTATLKIHKECMKRRLK